MTTQNLDDATAIDRSDRVDTLGWGALFVALGAVSLMPAMPDGTWLVAVGLIMIGASAARAWLRLPVRGITVVVGIVALAAGSFSVAGLTTAVGPLVLIVLGITLIVAALREAQRQTGRASLAQSR